VEKQGLALPAIFGENERNKQPAHMLLMPKKPNMDKIATPEATQAFDAVRQQRLQQRATRRRERMNGPQFIYNRIAQDMAERLLMINRRFNKALLIAPDGFEALFRSHIHIDKDPVSLLATPLAQLGTAIKDITGFDLIILCMAHHNENNPAGLLTALKSRMVDDGHIMTVCLGGETLSTLRTALYTVDQAHFGGISPRIHPMITIQQNVQLLAHCGFNLTMGDRDNLTVTYKSLSTLIGDLRDMGESYALNAKRAIPLSRSYWKTVETALKSETDKIETAYDILWSSGWTPHDSQQKPLKPGSGKVHLSDAFKPRDKS